ncbi:helix-turn-helix domain-containing protein [Thalassolituus oleivorans]|uniref:helix-turn-helix domain-containing protein n=1 Tax=Thalassolituus oleivorans TaxID=187493 RepID=UPI003C6FC503
MTPFGIALNSLRRSKKIDQKALAQMIGVHHCHLSSIENGRKSPPKLETLDRLCHSLQLSDDEAEFLLDAARSSRKTIRIPNDMSLAEYRFVSDLTHRLGSLTNEELDAMQNILKFGNGMYGELTS